LGSDTQTLTYDAASRIVGTTHTNPANNRNYAYDALNRLTNQSDSTSYRVWDYDANGNRISEQSGATVYPYTIDTNSNRLLNVTGPVAKTYTYDAAGNPLDDGARTFTWNAAGRLTQTTISGSDTLYQYNGSGERVNKGTSGNSKTFFIFDPAGRLVGDYLENQATPQTGDWLLGQETVWFGNIPVAVIKQASPTDPVLVYMIHADHLNTPRVIVDSTNIPVWNWQNQNAFGNNSSNEDPDSDSNLFEYNLRFAGQYFDTETSLHYNYYRDYESATGRYLSSDPIGLAGGINTYGYALQNPLSFTDPDGLLPDIFADLLLISLDLISYAYNKYRGCDTSVDEASLAANVTGLFTPGVTGLGLGVRATGKVAKGSGKSRNKPPEPLKEAEGRPHSIIEKPGKGGQYTTHNGDGTWKQYRGSGQDHGGIPRPNVKEAGKNVTPDGHEFIDKGHVRPPRSDEIPGG
jgi:RHS repeat-associated protein